MGVNFYVQILTKDYQQRKNADPAYSISAHARFLNIDRSHLTKVLRRKAELSLKAAPDIAARLCLDANTREAFLISVALCNTIRYLNRHGLQTNDNAWVERLKLMAKDFLEMKT